MLQYPKFSEIFQKELQEFPELILSSFCRESVSKVWMDALYQHGVDLRIVHDMHHNNCFHTLASYGGLKPVHIDWAFQKGLQHLLSTLNTEQLSPFDVFLTPNKNRVGLGSNATVPDDSGRLKLEHYYEKKLLTIKGLPQKEKKRL